MTTFDLIKVEIDPAALRCGTRIQNNLLEFIAQVNKHQPTSRHAVATMARDCGLIATTGGHHVAIRDDNNQRIAILTSTAPDFS